MLPTHKTGAIVSSHLDADDAMTLHDALSLYLRSVEASPRYQESLRRTVKKLALYLLVHVRQLEPLAINDFLSRVPVGQTTKSNYRREILTLWRWAWNEGLTPVPPVKVKKVSPARKAPQAWSVGELNCLLDRAEADDTIVNCLFPHIRRCHILPAWIAVGFETGLRLTDMLNLREENIRRQTVVLTAHKTGKVTVREIGAYAMARCQFLLKNSPDGSLFSWITPRRRALLLWRSFLDQNGIAGSSKWLRRSAATELERTAPGTATRFLDHSAPHLARLHYVDPSLLLPPKGPTPLR